MGISAAPGMTSEEIAALSRAHTLFSWSQQNTLDPIAIDTEGRRVADVAAEAAALLAG